MQTTAVPVNPESVLAREGPSMSRTLVEIMRTQQAIMESNILKQWDTYLFSKRDFNYE